MTEYKETPGGKVAVKVGMAAVVTRAADGSQEPVDFEGPPAPVVKELTFAELASLLDSDELDGEEEARKVFADHHQQGRVINN